MKVGVAFFLLLAAAASGAVAQGGDFGEMLARVIAERDSLRARVDELEAATQACPGPRKTLMVVGGVANAHLYDQILILRTGACAWQSLPDDDGIVGPRAISGSAVANNTFYLIGGAGGNPGVELDSFVAFSADDNRWTTLPSLPVANKIGAGGCAYVPERDSIFCLLSQKQTPVPLYEFSFSNNSWTARTPLSTPRLAHSLVSLGGGRIFVAGGNSNGNNGGGLRTSYMYNTHTDSWVQMADAPTEYTGQAAVVQPASARLGGDVGVLLFDGKPADGTRSPPSLYFASNDTWVLQPPLASLGNYFYVGFADAGRGRAYVAGGSTKYNEWTTEVTYTDTLRNLTVQLPPLPNAVQNPMVGVLEML